MAQQTQKPTSPESDGNSAADSKQVEQAQQTRAAAERDAAKIRKAAEEAAEKIKRDAQAQADKIKRAAEAEARKTRKAIEAEARRTELANREAREAEQAARDEAEQIREAAADAAQERQPAGATFMVEFTREQLEAAGKLTQAIWERNLSLVVGMVPAYLDVYEQALAGVSPYSRAATATRETAKAGATVARELLNV